MAAVTISSDFGGPQNKVSHCFHCFPSFCHEVMRPDAMILVFWMLSFKPSFSLSSINFIERLFSSSSLSSIMVVSSVYLRLFIFFLAILIPACISSCLAFCLTYSAYKLNKQGDNIQPWHSPFLIWNQSVVPCPVLTVDSWPVYRFLRRHIRWSGTPNSLRIFHRLLWSTQSEVLAFQDGWVEGCELIFSCEDSKTTTCCWTNIDRRVLDSPPKRYPTSKGKGEAPARWEEGQNRI